MEIAETGDLDIGYWGYCLDANVLITAVEVHYPPENFPSFYEQLAAELSKKALFIQEIFDEIEDTKNINNSNDLKTWIQDSGFRISPLNNDVIELSRSLGKKYDIKLDHISRGVSSKDIALIAFAKKINLR